MSPTSRSWIYMSLGLAIAPLFWDVDPRLLLSLAAAGVVTGLVAGFRPLPARG